MTKSEFLSLAIKHGYDAKIESGIVMVDLDPDKINVLSRLAKRNKYRCSFGCKPLDKHAGE